MSESEKKEAEREIKIFFSNLKRKKPEEIKKIKKLAMKHNIKLGTLRKQFCKKCYSPDLKVKKVTGKIKTMNCESCGNISRYKIR